MKKKSDYLLKIPEAAKLAGVSRQAVYLWIEEGKITPINIRYDQKERYGCWRISRRELEDFLRKRKARKMRIAKLKAKLIRQKSGQP